MRQEWYFNHFEAEVTSERIGVEKSSGETQLEEEIQAGIEA